MKIFQLIVARAVLGFGVRDIGRYLGLSGTTIHAWEKRDLNSQLNTSLENICILEQFFTIKNIIFPDHNSVFFSNSYGDLENLIDNNISRFQLKGGRAILRYTRKQLADSINIDEHVIARAEKLNNEEYIRPKDMNINLKIKNIFAQKKILLQKKSTIVFNPID